MTFELIITLFIAVAWCITLVLLFLLNWQVLELQSLVLEVLHELRRVKDTTPPLPSAPAIEIAPIIETEDVVDEPQPFWNDLTQLHGAMNRISETGEVPDHAILAQLSPNDAYHALADRMEDLEKR
jgi:hypothetical protein